MRLGLLVFVGLTTAFELGCAARVPSGTRQTSAAVLAAGPSFSRDAPKPLREALEATKRNKPAPQQQGENPVATLFPEVPTENRATPVGTSGGEVPSPTADTPTPTASAPTPAEASPPSAGEGSAGAGPQQTGAAQVRMVVIGLGFVATIVLLVFVLFSEHHRHE